ncbi:MAG: ABC transporter ATP-binding protein [Clostridia bacterium]|nr:ABC transporter ATP-binding protein [Clostridia bacterium]
MRHLFQYLKAYKKESIISPLFKLLEAGFDLFVPIVIAAIIDRGIAQEDKGFVWGMTALLVLLALIGLSCSLIAQYFAAKASVGMASDLRHDLFAKLQSFSYADTDKIGVATMITRLTSDINQLQAGVNWTLRLFLRSPVIVLGAVICAFFIDPKIAIVFAVLVPILALVVFFILLFTAPLYTKAQGKLDSVTQLTRENLNGARVVRAFCREQPEIDAFEQANRTHVRSQFFVGRISALLNPLTYLLINLGIIVLLQVGAIRVNVGSLTQGQVVALFNYMSQILIELIKLANTTITVTKSIACGNRIFTVLDLKTGLDDSAQQDNPVQTAETGDEAVSFRHVSLTYDGAAAPSLNEINFTAMQGDTVGIIGGTGCGKSSLVSLIARFYDVTQGQVLVNGRDVRTMDPETLRRKIGFVPQKAVLFKGTVRSNLLWGKEDATDEELWEALTLAQAADFIRERPLGLDSEVEAGGKNFSGGQRQRLTIARALVRKPGILILDDSSSALDFATDARLRRALSSLPYHPTLFLISQRTSSIRSADRILVLEHGNLVASGTHSELLKTSDVYREIHSSQTKAEAEGGLE